MEVVLLLVVILFLVLGAFGTWCSLILGARCEDEYREKNRK